MNDYEKNFLVQERVQLVLKIKAFGKAFLVKAAPCSLGRGHESRKTHKSAEVLTGEMLLNPESFHFGE